MVDQQGKTLISVVLPNYNGRDLLESNLPSLYKALEKGDFDFEIIVADDCSIDDSLDFLRHKYPDAKIVQNESNSGFSVTCNLGIKHAAGEYICVTNTDVMFDEDYFLIAMKELSKERVFAVKGDIINYADNRQNVINIERTRLLYFKKGFLRFKNGPLQDESCFDISFVALGCCFICNAAILKELCGFDEIYAPYYWEDDDLPLRAIERNYTVNYVPECIVYHKLSSTIGTTQTKTKRKLISNRNKFIFSWQHMKGLKRWLLHLFFTTFFLLTRWLILDWKYYCGFIMALSRVFLFRKKESSFMTLLPQK